MDKRSLWQFILSVLLIAYLAVVVPFCIQKVDASPLRGMDIVVNDPDGIGFVTPQDVDMELDTLSSRITGMARSKVNTLEIERYLKGLDRIDRATCAILNNGRLRLEVSPMNPVARVFKEDGSSYYVSADAKRIDADVRYHIDVPVVSADFDSIAQAADVLPVLDFIRNNPTADALVSSVKVDRKGDIILVPIIRGHVINFGDKSDIDNKWERLKVIYREVMPVKGWEYYDTLSVKWRGQVVATRRTKAIAEPSIQSRMLTDTLLPDADMVDIQPVDNSLYETETPPSQPAGSQQH